MMKGTLGVFFLLAISANASSQVLTIKNQVTREPLELVSLLSEHPKAYATTNAEGQVDIGPFRGAEKIIISGFGLKTVVRSYSDLESPSLELFLEPSPLGKHEVVVSATRWRQATGDVPLPVTSVWPEEAALQNPQTTADLLGLSGEVFIQKSQQAGGSPMIRGFATNRLLTTVDGIRMNTAIFRVGNIQNVISLDPFAIENTEVLFGPGSMIYGSDAIGGVMSFQTLTPRFSLSDQPLISGQAVGRTSSADNEKTGHLDVNVGWEKWALVTSISSFDFGNLRQGAHGPKDYLKPFYVQRQDGVDRVITQDDPLLQIPSAYSQVNLMQKVRYRPDPRWDLRYAFQYSATSPYGRYDRNLRLRNGLPRYAEWDYGPQKWMMNNLSVNHLGANVLYDQMTLRLAQQSFEESRIDRALNDQEKHIRVEKVQAYSANLDFIKALGSRDTLFCGAEYVLNDVDSTGTDENVATGLSVPGPSRYPQATWKSVAAYLTDQHRISENLLLVGGLRYNRFYLDAAFDTTFYPFPFTTARINNDALTWSLGAVYRPSPSWIVSANVATAFRSPNVDDMGKVFDSEPGSVVVPNPDLGPEYAYSADLSATKVFGDWVQVDVSGFYTSLQEAMVRRDFTLNGEEYILYDGVLSRVQAVQNAAVANVFGVQAGIDVRLPSGFSFSSDLSFQEGEEELDDGTTSPSRHAAPLFGVSRLSYEAGKLRLQLYAIYQAERDHDDLAEEEKAKTEIYAADKNGNTYAPAWYTLNFKALYRLTESWSVSAGVENITDRRYRPYSSGISGPGRNFILSLGANF
jgi:hemoglobin/transferrin/lactoferrin receptor protein